MTTATLTKSGFCWLLVDEDITTIHAMSDGGDASKMTELMPQFPGCKMISSTTWLDKYPPALETTEYEVPFNEGQSGKFYIGDLGYVIEDPDEWVNVYCKTLDDGVREYKGLHYAMITTHGDGYFKVYEDIDDDGEYQHVDSLPVDAGHIGIIPWELVTDKDYAMEMGMVVEYLDDNSQFVTVVRRGNLNISVRINGEFIPIDWDLKEEMEAKYVDD